MYLKKLTLTGLIVILGVLFSSTAVYACHPWIIANKYSQSEEGTIRFHIATGHRYPFGHSFYSNDNTKKMYILTSEGKRCELVPRDLGKGEISQVQYESKKKMIPGTHILVMEGKGSFGAKTSDGYKRKSKADLKGEKIKGKVSFSRNFCKAVVNIEGKSNGKSYSSILGHPLEIVPLKDPAGLRAGDFLPVKILHNGKILEDSVMVYATYMGFSTAPDVFAYNSRASYKKGGIAEIKILKPGIWMIFVSHKFPYPDADLADEYSYQYTLTFEVK